MTQYSLFPAPPEPASDRPASSTPSAASAASIDGLSVRIEGASGPRACACGHATFLTGPGKAQHAASLCCARCQQHAGWLSREAAEFLADVIRRFGRPTSPIVIRRQGGPP